MTTKEQLGEATYQYVHKQEFDAIREAPFTSIENAFVAGASWMLELLRKDVRKRIIKNSSTSFAENYEEGMKDGAVAELEDMLETVMEPLIDANYGELVFNDKSTFKK